MPKVRGQDATHWRRRVLDMKILAYIYLFDILLKITSPRLNGLTNLIFNLHVKDIHDFFNRLKGRVALTALYFLDGRNGYLRHVSEVLLGNSQDLTLQFHYFLNFHTK